MKRLVFGLLFLLLVIVNPSLSQESKADLVLLNGNVYTGDLTVGRVEAIAVADGKIAAAGSSEDIRSRIGPETRVIDLEGKFVMPGFNDAHVHIWLAAQQLMNVDAEGTASIAEFQQRIRDHIQTRESGRWVLGGGWDQSLWKENRMPTRADLDAVSTDFLIALSRVDGHSIIVNTPVLEKAGITRDTKDPEGGQIVRDEQGEPTGWIKDRAVGLVMGLVPEETREQRKQGMLKVLALARRLGVTSIQDDSIRFDNIESFRALKELQAEGKLTARINVMLPFEYPLDDLIQLRDEIGTDDPWLHTGLLKTETDGSGGSLSAAMYEPFANAPGNRGYMKIEPGKLEEMILDRDAAGFQIALHAIGDRANRIVLDGFEKARKVNGRTNTRHRIEHVQYIQDVDLKRFQELGIIASMQPVHLLAEIRWTKTLLGSEREYQAYRVRSLLDAGARVTLGTDFPVERLEPLRGLYAAVAREFEAGGPEGGYQPQEKISIEEAIRAYTSGSAYAEFQEQHKGTLAPGMLADFIVLSNDLMQISPSEILTTQVLMTVVNGGIVYEK